MSSYELTMMRLGHVLSLFIYIAIVLANDVIKTTADRLSDVDPLLEAIQLEEWHDEEVPCLQATLAMLYGVKNSTLWATWIWDSMQRPTGFLYGSRYQLGSFDQCMKPPWLHSHPHLRTQYCLADILLTDTRPRKPTSSLDPYSSTSLYFDTTSKYGRHMNVLTWGVCLPSVCSQGSVHKLVQVMVRTQHLHPITPKTHITVDSCQLAGDPVEYFTEFYAFLSLILTLTIISILATVLSGYMIKKSFAKGLVSSFDLKKNYCTFIENQDDEIKSLNGMKFISTGTMIASHYIFFTGSTAIINGLDIEKDWNTALGTSLLRVDVVLDTFNFISGLLLMKGLISGKQTNPLVVLLKRYVRILCPLAIMVFYFIGVHKYVGSGPLWPRYSSEQEDLCRRNWWINLLMLPNYVRSTEICHLVTWYISSDFQLAIVGTILFYVYQKNRKFGKWLFSISVIVAALIPALVTYWKEIPAILISNIQILLDLSENEMFYYVHIKPHCRAVPYLLGMLMGHYMSFYKPTDYRNIISKKWSVCGAVCASYIMHKVLREGGLLVHKEYDLTEAAVYAALNRICWSIAVCCFIVVCEYGYVPIVNQVLCMKSWGPLSKLCYSHYIFHMAVIFRHVNSVRTPIFQELFALGSNGVGVVFSILPISLYLYLFVEAPAGNLANCLLGSKKTQEYGAVMKENKSK